MRCCLENVLSPTALFRVGDPMLRFWGVGQGMVLLLYCKIEQSLPLTFDPGPHSGHKGIHFMCVRERVCVLGCRAF